MKVIKGTKKDIETEKKKELNESEEYFKQVEKPISQGGASKFVVDTIKEEEKQKKNTEDDIKTYLQGKHDAFFTYRKALAERAKSLLLDLDDEYEYHVIPTEESRINLWGKNFATKQGILFVIKTPSGKVFAKGLRVSSNPEIDMGAVSTMINEMENTIDSDKGILLSDKPKQTKSGIILP